MPENPPLLSRVADSVYWMARYIERAEDITRLLAVNFDALLDIRPEDTRAGWLPLVTITGDEEANQSARPLPAAWRE